MKKDHRGRTGSHSARPRGRKSGQIDEPFIVHRRSMLESSTWGSLTLAARRILDRLELEHLSHAGRENGSLPCSYRDFETFGVRKASVKVALDLLILCGFLRITELGRAGNGEWRRVAKYRLTYLRTLDAEPTDDWKAHAQTIAPPPDIDSGLKNASEPVGSKTRPKHILIGSENVSGVGSENASGDLDFRSPNSEAALPEQTQGARSVGA